jgi:hypothetical protein
MEGGDLITLCTEQVAFRSAVQSCGVTDEVLNLPESAEENGRLSWQIAKNNYAKVWLGGNDIETEGTWLDDDGNVFWQGTETGEAVDGQFTAWELGQPNSVTPLQNCAFSNAGLWGDTECADLYVYSCRARAGAGASCGDGHVDPGEACDDGVDTKDCDSDCTVARCGDGYRNAVADEECDGGSPEACSDTCRSTGLVAYFPLTEQRGAAAYDVVSWTRSGQLLGDARFTGAADGVVLNHVGAISVKAAQAPTISGDITMMAFVRPDVVPEGYADLVELYTSTDETYLRFNGATLQLGSWASGMSYETSKDVASTLTPGTYIHVAGTWDGASWRLYVDGVLVSEVAAAIGAIPPGGPLVIGGREDFSRGFDGKIVDVRLYEVALPQGDIQAISDALHQQFQ